MAASALGPLATVAGRTLLELLKNRQFQAIVAGFGVSQIIGAILGGDDETKAMAPRFAIVDLKQDRIVMLLSAKRVYRLLTAPRRRPPTRKVVHVIQDGRADIVAPGVRVVR